jgi:hypothetical protein
MRGEARLRGLWQIIFSMIISRVAWYVSMLSCTLAMF